MLWVLFNSVWLQLIFTYTETEMHCYTTQNYTTYIGLAPHSLIINQEIAPTEAFKGNFSGEVLSFQMALVYVIREY